MLIAGIALAYASGKLKKTCLQSELKLPKLMLYGWSSAIAKSVFVSHLFHGKSVGIRDKLRLFGSIKHVSSNLLYLSSGYFTCLTPIFLKPQDGTVVCVIDSLHGLQSMVQSCAYGLNPAKAVIQSLSNAGLMNIRLYKYIYM